jgi:hypothetical protein
VTSSNFDNDSQSASFLFGQGSATSLYGNWRKLETSLDYVRGCEFAELPIANSQGDYLACCGSCGARFQTEVMGDQVPSPSQHDVHSVLDYRPTSQNSKEYSHYAQSYRLKNSDALALFDYVYPLLLSPYINYNTMSQSY